MGWRLHGGYVDESCHPSRHIDKISQIFRTLYSQRSLHLNVQAPFVFAVNKICYSLREKPPKAASALHNDTALHIQGGDLLLIAPLVSSAPSLMFLTKDMMLLRAARKWAGVTFMFLISDKDLVEQQSISVSSRHPRLIKTPRSHGTD